MVFEPSYALGCLALLSSLTRHASRPVSVDILMRAKYRRAADNVIDTLKRVYKDKVSLQPVIVPQEILEKCAVHRFRAHFIPEILFRLYYFDMVKEQGGGHVIYLDLDMILLGDIFSIEHNLTTPALLHAVEDELTEDSRTVMPPRITRYLNSGLLTFDATDTIALNGAMRKAQEIVEEIAATALYVDQDAINIAFHDNIDYLPPKWNFTLFHFKGYPIPGDIVVLHATGSQKPWFFRGRHPFSAWYEKEAELLGLAFFQRYDFWWAPRRLVKKAKGLLGR